MNSTPTATIPPAGSSAPAGDWQIVLECLPHSSRRQDGHPIAARLPQLQLLLRVRTGSGSSEEAEVGSVLSRFFRSRLKLTAEHSPAPVTTPRLYAVVSREAGEQAREWLSSLGMEIAPTSLETPDPDEVIEHRCEVQVGNRWATTLIVTHYPRSDSEKWLDKLLGLEANLDLSLHVQGAAASLFIGLWANDRHQLQTLTDQAVASLAQHHIKICRPYFQAAAALRATLPWPPESTPPAGNLHASSIAAALVEAARPQSERVYGLDPGTRAPIRLDRFRPDTPTHLLLAGEEHRSTQVALELVAARLAGISIHLIGSDVGHGPLVRALGGKTVEIGPTHPLPFNPFAIPPNQAGALSARLARLVAVIELLTGELSVEQCKALDDALTVAFALGGHTDDADPPGLPAPDLSQVAGILRGQTSRLNDKADGERELLASRLDHYATDPGRWLFGQGSRPDPAAGALIAYTLAADLPESQRAAAMLLCLTQAQIELRETAAHGLIVLDRVEHLAISERATRCVVDPAGSGVAITLASSDVPAVLKSRLREAITRSSITTLTRPLPAVMADLARLFHLTPSEQGWLLEARDNEGLLIAQGKRRPFETVMSQEEHRLIKGGTNP
jgi:hypothetical protein